MKSKRPELLAKNASKMHKKVGELLLSGYFKGYEIRQEYPVNQVNPNFKSGREKFDWVILGGIFSAVIEVHGEQHYNPVCFGGRNKDEAREAFKKQKVRDELKREAAESAGWAYLVVRYDDKLITAESLSGRILEAINESTGKKTRDEMGAPKVRINSRGFSKDGPTQKIQNRGEFPKREGKYKWPKRKLNQ